MKYQLAQINIAKLLKPTDHPQIAEFVNQLDTINTLAEKSNGFIWRLKDEGSTNATALNPFNDPMIIVNMSVWTSIEALKAFVYSSDHKKVFLNRKEWFEKPTQTHMALWWIEEGDFPTVQEGKSRLLYLMANGSTDYAFTFGKIKTPKITDRNHIE